LPAPRLIFFFSGSIGGGVTGGAGITGSGGGIGGAGASFFLNISVMNDNFLPFC